MGRVTDFFGAIWVLVTLGWVSRFRLSGRYWAWRTQTAFPEGSASHSQLGKLGLVLEYAKWAWRMRRLR
jgi:hypothetical protein